MPKSYVALFAGVGIVLTSFVACAETTQVQFSPQVRNFVLAGDDGYGTNDCLSGKSSCGKIVADAWCETKGYARADNWRKLGAEEITNSIEMAPRHEQAFMVACSR